MRAETSHLIATPAVLEVDGDLAGIEVARLAARLWPHLLTAPPETFVDLGMAATVDAAGVDLLAAARAYAVHRGLAVGLINATPGVRRALRATGMTALPASGTGAEPAAAETTSHTAQGLAATVMS